MSRSSLFGITVAAFLVTVTVVPVGAARGADFGLSAVPQVQVPFPNLAAVRAEDEQRESQGGAPRFAIPNEVLVSPATDGVWKDLDARTRQWHLRITSAGALSLNLGFGAYYMPPGGQLWIYAANGTYALEPYTDFDNADHGELWTAVVLSDDIIVEVTIPRAVERELILQLTSINVGYRGFGALTADKSGACEINVICPDGDGWRNEIPAIAVISTGGSRFCTGFMVNNTAQNQVPYFMTANHCGITSSNAASLVVYWNFFSPTCGVHGGGSLSTHQSGSTFRAAWSTSDFTLVQLSQSPNPAWGITYAGWDRRDVNATSIVGIHHPNCDEKSISFSVNATAVTSYLGSSTPGDGTHLKTLWQTSPNRGATEPGSSGSPLFDQNHRVLGQLHGGYSACGASDMRDWYGRFFKSWTGNATNSTRLSNWLDPNNTGLQYVDTLSTSCTAPAITGQPSNQTVCSGGSASFSVTASGTAPLSYQWRKGTTNLTEGGNISGSTTATLTINPVGTGDAATNYNCVVTNACGSATSSNAALTVNPLPVAPTSAASDRDNFCTDDAGNISLSATGGSGTTLRWLTGGCTGTSIGTGNPLVIASPTATTTYYARWENTCGNSTCASVTVTVLPLPVAPTSAASDRNNFCADDAGNISLSATGGSGTTLRWLTGSCTGTSIGTGSPLVIASPTASTTYYARWENTCGNSTCASVTVTVNPLPDCTITPTPPQVCASSPGNTASVPAGAATYAWTITNGTITAGAGTNQITYTAGATGPVHLTVTVTSAAGCVCNNATDVPVVTCGATGACCHTNGTCAVVSSAACATAGGVYSGDGTVCRPGNLCPASCKGDMNCDGSVTFADIDLFVQALNGETAWTGWPCPWLNADANNDLAVTFADIDPFVALIGTTCP